MRTIPFFAFKTIIILLLLISSGCVSVNLGSGGPKKAKDLVMKEPSSPFQKIDTENADSAWQSKKTGNTIALITECSKADLPLESMRDELLAALSDAKITENNEVLYNKRKALHSSALGTVDGVQIQLETLVFKKNQCQFSLTYVGREKLFANEKTHFDQFTQDFVVP